MVVVHHCCTTFLTVAFVYVDASELNALLIDPANPVAVLAGAWVSVPMPTGVLDAWRWKSVVIDGLSTSSGWRRTRARCQQDEGMSRLGGTEDLKLERVLEAVERIEEFSGAAIVALVAQGTPNPLHHHLAQGLRRGSIREVITPNFDELIEQALGSPQSSDEPRPSKRPIVRHPHGRASEPASLRHILARFEERLPPGEHEEVARSLSGEVVCLGWAATDPDLLAAMREGSGTIHFLIARDEPDEATASNLKELAKVRPLKLYRGGFEQLSQGGGPVVSLPSTDDFAPTLEEVRSFIAGLPVAEVRRAYVALSYEYSLATTHQADQAALLSEWQEMGLSDQRERHLFLMSNAELAQASGRSLYAAWLNLRDFTATRDPYRISEAGDAIERSLRGLNPLKGPLGLTFHLSAISLYERGGKPSPPWARARLARALTRMGRCTSAETILTEIIDNESDGLDLWVRAHCYRLRALARARGSGAQSWEHDIGVAIRLFEFAGRRLEVGNTLRARALCEVIAGETQWRNRSMKSLEDARKQYELATDASAPALLQTQILVTRRLGRRTAAFLLTSL